MNQEQRDQERRDIFRFHEKSTGILAFICAAIVVLMFGYCFYVAFVGISNDSLFFNLVELTPLGMTMLVCWISWLMRAGKAGR